jgi:hypothetical protein
MAMNACKGKDYIGSDWSTKKGGFNQTWAMWKRRVLALSENRHWTAESLDRWLAAGGGHHLLESSTTMESREKKLRKLMDENVIKPSPTRAVVCFAS